MQALTRRLANAEHRPWPDRPVPIALVITELDVGGAERMFVALATRLDRRRWDPRVIALGPDGPMSEPLRAAGTAPICLAVNQRRPVNAVLRLAQTLRPHAPRLVQSFLFHANLATRLAAPLAGRPWVLSGLRVAERQKRWHLLLDRVTGRAAAGSVCVSEGVLHFTRDVCGTNPERLCVIRNGVDPAPFDTARPADRAALGVPADAHLVLCVGRLHVQKGHPYLLEAAERICLQRPDWHLAVAGSGPERERLRQWTSESPILKDRVHWLGPRNDVPALLKASDLLVLPSLWEGMPNVVLEAMAARRAVVATAVEGSEELVQPGRSGWLVPPSDPAALAAALLDAVADPGRLRRYGESGRARVEADLSLDRMVDAYEQLWAGVLGLELPIPESVLPSFQGLP